jgi:hypothetical protein
VSTMVVAQHPEPLGQSLDKWLPDLQGAAQRSGEHHHRGVGGPGELVMDLDAFHARNSNVSRARQVVKVLWPGVKIGIAPGLSSPGMPLFRMYAVTTTNSPLMYHRSYVPRRPSMSSLKQSDPGQQTTPWRLRSGNVTTPPEDNAIGRPYGRAGRHPYQTD